MPDANAVLIPKKNTCIGFDQGELKNIDKFDKDGNRVGFIINYTQSDKAKLINEYCPNGGRSEPYKLDITTYCN